MVFCACSLGSPVVLNVVHRNHGIQSYPVITTMVYANWIIVHWERGKKWFTA